MGRIADFGGLVLLLRVGLNNLARQKTCMGIAMQPFIGNGCMAIPYWLIWGWHSPSAPGAIGQRGLQAWISATILMH
ncbi:hypothetical protein [Chitinilyticum litopenaei]|uniref:hypothetical protein n=1 Tax=Chitinilyticum litopenaei TaxID=1121276 RepID=UPI0003F8E920|nr:hypothetical protein [Chitinilyticum litopenaei]